MISLSDWINRNSFLILFIKSCIPFLPARPEKPSTIVAPHEMEMMNLVPQDSAHPLYRDSPPCRKMRHNFLLDSMVIENVKLSNTKMKENSGLSVSNMNDQELVFKKNTAGTQECLAYTMSKEGFKK